MNNGKESLKTRDRGVKSGEATSENFTLLEKYLDLVEKMVNKICKKDPLANKSKEDLIQVGNLALLEAIKDYSENPESQRLSFKDFAAIKVRKKVKATIEQFETSSKQNHPESYENVLHQAPEEIDIDEEVDKETLKKLLLSFLEKLSVDERAVIEARYLSDLMESEGSLAPLSSLVPLSIIAKSMHIPIDRARSLEASAFTKFRGFYNLLFEIF